MRSYAIGDIHGQSGMLAAAHARIDADRARTGDADAPVIHLGDLVDRGPDAKGVIEMLMAGRRAGKPWIVLKGNHDRMFVEALARNARDPALRADLGYLSPAIGGRETLASYGVTGNFLAGTARLLESGRKAVPKAHLDFIDALPLFHLRGDCLFVHAGIRPGVPLEDQEEDDLLWIRDAFLLDTRDHGRLVVHGHTPVETPEHLGNRVALDTGAGFGRPLTAAVIEGRDVCVLTDTGRVPLRPFG